MFFSFMLDSTAGGRNNARPHSFLQTHNSWRLEKVTQSLRQSSHHHSQFTSLTESESLTNQQGYIFWHCSRIILERLSLFNCIKASSTSGIIHEKYQNDFQTPRPTWHNVKSNLLTQYTWGKLSGTAWYWWLEYTFGVQPGGGLCHISALTQISPIPHHYSSGVAGEREDRWTILVSFSAYHEMQYNNPHTATMCLHGHYRD